MAVFTVEQCKDGAEDYKFGPLNLISYHFNAGIAVIGLFYTITLTFHATFKYFRTLYQIKQDEKNRVQKSKRPRKMNSKAFCALISVLIFAVFLFIIYTIEFWLWPICVALECDLDAYKFCNIFQHFLYVSVIAYTWMLYVYFSGIII